MGARIITLLVFLFLFTLSIQAEIVQDFFTLSGMVKSYTDEIIEITSDGKSILVPKAEVLGEPNIKLGKRICLSIKTSGIDSLKIKKNGN